MRAVLQGSDAKRLGREGRTGCESPNGPAPRREAGSRSSRWSPRATQATPIPSVHRHGVISKGTTRLNAHPDAFVALSPPGSASPATFHRPETGSRTTMTGDESDSVVLVLCRTSQVESVLRQLRMAAVLTRPSSDRPNQAHDSTVPAPAPREVEVRDTIESLRQRHDLTDAQCVVLALRFEGRPTRQVADALGIEVGTVKAHVHDALRKIGTTPGTRIDALFLQKLREYCVPVSMAPENAAWRDTLRAAQKWLATTDLRTAGAGNPLPPRDRAAHVSAPSDLMEATRVGIENS